MFQGLSAWPKHFFQWQLLRKGQQIHILLFNTCILTCLTPKENFILWILLPHQASFALKIIYFKMIYFYQRWNVFHKISLIFFCDSFYLSRLPFYSNCSTSSLNHSSSLFTWKLVSSGMPYLTKDIRISSFFAFFPFLILSVGVGSHDFSYSWDLRIYFFKRTPFIIHSTSVNEFVTFSCFRVCKAN